MMVFSIWTPSKTPVQREEMWNSYPVPDLSIGLIAWEETASWQSSPGFSPMMENSP